MAKKISLKDISPDCDYESGVKMYLGISDENTSVKNGFLCYNVFPPLCRTKEHYHTNGDNIIFCLAGKCIWYIGQDNEEYLVEAEDFFFIPRGELHSQFNPSETEPCIIVGGYSDCSNPYQSGKILTKKLKQKQSK